MKGFLLKTRLTRTSACGLLDHRAAHGGLVTELWLWGAGDVLKTSGDSRILQGAWRHCCFLWNGCEGCFLTGALLRTVHRFRCTCGGRNFSLLRAWDHQPTRFNRRTQRPLKIKRWQSPFIQIYFLFLTGNSSKLISVSKYLKTLPMFSSNFNAKFERIFKIIKKEKKSIQTWVSIKM